MTATELALNADSVGRDTTRSCWVFVGDLDGVGAARDYLATRFAKAAHLELPRRDVLGWTGSTITLHFFTERDCELAFRRLIALRR